MPPYPLKHRLLACAGLVLACVLVYYPGLSGGFLFDDFPNIVTNTRLHIESLDWDSLKRAAQAYAPGGYGRPLATLGFAMDYAIGGKDPWGYKVHGLVVHAINALLVLALASRLLPLAGARGPWPAWAAFALALVWAVHPLQVSTVLYVVQRMEMLALTFTLLALLAYLRGRLAQREGRSGWRWLVVAGGLAGVGMLAKETAVLFPLYAVALELTLLGFAAGQARTRRFLKVAYAVSFGAALLVFVGWVLPAYTSPEAYALRDFTLHERLLTQLRVLPMYLGQMLLPLPDSMPFYYDNYPVSKGLLDPPATLAGGLLLMALLGAAVALRRRLPLVSLGLLWFFASHVLTSNVINLELVFEHRNYFALLGVLLAVAGLLQALPRASDGRALAYGVAAIAIGCGLLAAVRSATWGNPLLLATELVARNPGSPRASSDLATLYIGMSDSQPNSPFFAFGKREFERGARLPGASPLPEQGLILMAATTGQPVDDAWWDSLVEKVRTRPIGPQETMAVTGLVQQRFEGIELDDARLSEAFEALLARGQRSPSLHIQYANFALVYLKDETLAERQFLAAIDSPGMGPEYAARIIAGLVMDGHPAIAEAVQARARENGLLDE
jgi:hypothetical protein